MSDPFLLSRILLKFDRDSDDLIGELSAVAKTPDGSLWLGSDELTSIERLSPLEPGVYGAHQLFRIEEFVELIDDSEIDIEGMDYADGYLWVVGSHSFKRKKPKGKKTEKDLERLSEIKRDANRNLLVRIPILHGQPVKSCATSDDAGDRLFAAALTRTEASNLLLDTLKEDEHLGPFVEMQLPSKDNGLDIEGLAVRGDRIFLGLRGPVLRGWAIVIEIQVEASETGQLTLRELDDGRHYRKHFVDLNGLGIRELCFHGDDLIVLGGPTMDLEGAMQVFRLKDILEHDGDTLWDGESGILKLLFNLPFTIGADHAEGLTLFPCFEEDGLMVVYDSPHPERRPSDRAIFADVFRLPQ
ncbi:hypothetical protein CKA32_001314 [Geitlerinema sp. FC II]|nr:hypothetical protein CKA32_001314 [Geitlerinema sp. FC II]